MYTVKVESDFAAAHFLEDYHGKCEKLHGHNYRVRLWLKGETLDDSGMLVDFSEIKKVLREITKDLDHSSLNDMAVFKNNPSAERIAFFIFEKTKEKLKEIGIDAFLLHAVDVYETRTNMARYEG